MRIIGGHDYYDTAIAFGSDPTVVFVREKSQKIKNVLPEPPTYFRYHEHDFINKNNKHFNTHSKFTLEIEPITIYVVGVKYTGVKLIVEFKYDSAKEIHFFWSEPHLYSYLNSLGAYIKLDRYIRMYRESITIQEHFSQSGTIKELELCISNRIIIATWCKSSGDEKEDWRINGDNLKDFEFYRVLDPFRCYQEIAMYVGGVLPKPGKPMVEISDKSKITKHGMDKWSFRKMGAKSK